MEGQGGPPASYPPPGYGGVPPPGTDPYAQYPPVSQAPPGGEGVPMAWEGAPAVAVEGQVAPEIGGGEQQQQQQPQEGDGGEAPKVESGENDGDATMQEDAPEEEKEEEPPVDPHPTVYVNNINEKIKGEKLLRGLRQVFAPYGKIRKVAVRKGIKLRGQAFVTYNTTVSASEAVERANGFNFYGKPLRVRFSRKKSDLTLRAEGEEPPKRPAHTRKGMVPVKVEKQEAPAAAPMGMGAYPPAGYPGGMLMPPGVMPPGAVMMNPNGLPGYPPVAPAPIVPHNVLLATGLPLGASDDMLSALFTQYAGFKEVRLVPGKGVAFVDFNTEPEATVAMQALNGFKVDADHAMSLNYARK